MEKDYKKGIIDTLSHISDDVFLRRVLIILLYHVQKKGGAA